MTLWLRVPFAALLAVAGFVFCVVCLPALAGADPTTTTIFSVDPSAVSDAAGSLAPGLVGMGGAVVGVLGAAIGVRVVWRVVRRRNV